MAPRKTGPLANTRQRTERWTRREGAGRRCIAQPPNRGRWDSRHDRRTTRRGVARVRRARPAARDAGRALDAAGDARQEACGSATAFIPSRYVTPASLTLGTGKPARNGQETRALLFASVARARALLHERAGRLGARRRTLDVAGLRRGGFQSHWSVDLVRAVRATRCDVASFALGALPPGDCPQVVTAHIQ